MFSIFPLPVSLEESSLSEKWRNRKLCIKTLKALGRKPDQPKNSQTTWLFKSWSQTNPRIRKQPDYSSPEENQLWEAIALDQEVKATLVSAEPRIKHCEGTQRRERFQFSESSKLGDVWGISQSLFFPLTGSRNVVPDEQRDQLFLLNPWTPHTKRINTSSLRELKRNMVTFYQ